MFGLGIGEYRVPGRKNCGWRKSECMCAYIDIKPNWRNNTR